MESFRKCLFYLAFLTFLSKMMTELPLSELWIMISGFLLRFFKDSNFFLLEFSSSTLIKGKGKGIDPEKRSFLIFHPMCFRIMTSHYSLRTFIFHFLARGLKFRNTFVLFSYFTMKLLISGKKSVIKNFSKISWKNWAYLPIVDWSIV